MIGLVLAAAIEFYGGSTGCDNTPAFNAAVVTGDRDLTFGNGSYRFDSKPNAIPFGMTIRGAGAALTVLQRNYPETSAYSGFLVWNGASGESGGGLSGLQLQTTLPGGSAIVLTGSDVAHRASVMDFSNFWITAAGVKWDLGFVVLGHYIIDQTNGGVRDVHLRNVYIFETLYNSVEAWGVKNFWVTAGQLGNPGNIFITGTPSVRSEHVFLNISQAGTLYLSNSSLVVVQGFCGGLWRNGTVDVLHVSGRIGLWGLMGSPAMNERIL